MRYTVDYQKYTLDFKFDARTSRGAMKSKDTYFVKVYRKGNPEVFGLGECSVLKGLSVDDREGYEQVLDNYCQQLSKLNDLQEFRKLPGLVEWPSIRFGFETAVNDLLNGGQRMVLGNAFRLAGAPLPINGLIWMGDKEFMLKQIDEKIKQGYHCIKLKIGGIAFEQECELLAHIRQQYAKEQIELRVDANGAFSPKDAMAKLEKLASFDLHSIEQPIRQGQYKEMARLCAESPLPIALDEELIGARGFTDKIQLLEKIQPQYIILKPSLLGGLRASEEWVEVCKSLEIGWWITSALEANIGLNAICQFTANYEVNMPQGLGTGQLYHNNIDSPLTVAEGSIRYDLKKEWNLEGLKI
ncbi:o-succinylbenzoate synthase [Rapidithrix thailandica]|uniref:O-succinylbenzoate synthase n=1 Tax=Rapidithrix thailandica TaxID=413964 RepID=A0AAW9RXU3_9BACT